MELLNRFLGMLFGRKSYECKAPGSTCLAVLWNVNIHDLADLTKELTELLVRRGKVEVPYEYLT